MATSESAETAGARVGATGGAPAADPAEARAGFVAGIASYGLWGVFPLLLRTLDGVSPLTITANRVVWAMIVVGGILFGRGRFDEVRGALRDRRSLMILFASAILLSINWLVVVWGVENHRVLEVSFGYFLTPLVNVAIGMAVLGERQNRWQALAIGIAVIAAALQAVSVGGVPLVSLTLAVTFAAYGYLRKTVNVGSAAGLFLETAMMLPFAVGFLAFSIATEGLGPHGDPRLMSLMVVTGLATAAPLLLFAYSARRLRLTTVGMLQYLAPSMHFMTAVFLFSEPLTPLRLVSFLLIWVSLAIFTTDSVWRRPRRPAPAA